MKKALLLSLGVAVSAMGFAFPLKSARPAKATKSGVHKYMPLNLTGNTNKLAKTTDITYDTTILGNDVNIVNNGDAQLYSPDITNDLDSGFLFGPNLFGFTGFAERYDVFPATNESINVLGIASLWGGTVNPNSTNSVALNIWSVDSSSALDPNFPNNPYYMSALPGSVINTASIPLTSLSLNLSGFTETVFPTPMNSYTGSFYAGYIPSFTFADGATAGDTVSLFSSTIDSGYNTFEAGIVNGDTTFYARTVTQINGSWFDNAFDLGFNNNYAIFPIVVVVDSGSTTGIAHVTANNLTIFANYPNPAISSTNLMFSLSRNANVTIQIYDAAGRLVNTISQANQSVGKHTVNISTASMPAGNYVCVFRTNLGDAIGSQLTVIK